jgi:tetratricopeptide (TPR) repeat protein
MINILDIRRLGIVVLLTAVAAGCAAAPAGSSKTKDSQTPAGPAVSAKARLPLERIEPAVNRPERPADLPPLSERAAKQIAAAQDLMVQQRYSEAAIKLEQALRYDPDHPQIHATLAWLHWQAGNVERAESHAERAIEGSADVAVAQFITGRGRAMADDYAGAIESYRRALLCSDFDPSSENAAQCHFHLADALAHEGYLVAALGQYEAFEDSVQRLKQRAAERAPSGAGGRPSAAVFEPAAREAKSKLLEELGRFADAADALRPLLESRSANDERAIRYARLLLKAGRTDDALAAARDIRSQTNEVFELLLAIYEKAGQPDRVFEELRSRIAERPDDAQLVLRLAELLDRMNKPAEARGVLSDFLERNPDARVLRERLVDALVTQGAWTDAVRECAAGIAQQAAAAESYAARLAGITGNPAALDAVLGAPPSDDAVEMYLRGLIARMVGRDKQAESILSRGHELDRSFIPTRVALAELYLAAYRYDDALEVATLPEARKEQHAALERILGRLYLRLDKDDEAERHLANAIRLDRGDARSLILLARLYDRARENSKAQRQLRMLLDMDPNNEEARELLAMLYMAEGKPDVAFEQLDQLKRISDNPATVARCEAILDPQLRADSDARRQHLLTALKQGDPDAATWIAVARTYNDFQPDQMRDAFQHALDVDPDNEEALLGLVQAHERLLEYEKAAERMTELLRRRPNRDAWRMALIELNTVVQDYETALVLARARDGYEDLEASWRFRYRMVILQLLRQTGRDADVVDLLQAWIAAESESKEWTARLADEYVQREQYALAVPLHEELYRAKPGDWSVLGRFLHALVESGAPDRALQYALDRLDTDPQSDSAVWMVAALLADTGHLDDGLELARNRLLHTANREAFQNLIIDRLRDAGRNADAVEFIEILTQQVFELLRALQEDRRPPSISTIDPAELVNWPNDPASPARLSERIEQLQLQHGLALLADKQYREAEDRISGWLDAARDPQSRSRYLRLLAACLRQSGDEQRANEFLHRALLIDPEDPLLNNDIAYAWIDAGVRLGEAEPMIRFALWRRPQEAAYLDTYGWLLYKRGDFAGAKKWIERAQRIRSPERADPVMFDHLGDICWRLEQKDRALDYWRRAREVIKKRSDGDGELNSADERRVNDVIDEKIEATEGGKEPPVADLAQPKPEPEE